MNKYVLLLAFSIIGFAVKAQSEVPTITDQQRLQFDSQIKGYVGDFCYYLSDLASSAISPDKKPQLKKMIRNLFIDPSTIEVRPASNPKRSKKYAVPEYLNIVSNYSGRFKVIMLDFYKVTIDTKHLRDTTINGTPGYTGSFSYWQRFRAAKLDDKALSLNPEKPIVLTAADYERGGSDDTKKTGVFYILKTANKTEGVSWYVLLGDVKAGEVIPYKADK